LGVLNKPCLTPYRSYVDGRSAGSTYVYNVYNNVGDVNNNYVNKEANKLSSLTKACEGNTLDGCKMKFKREQIQKVLKLKVVSWNVRSLNKLSKLKKLFEDCSDFILLQEVWQPDPDVCYLLPSSMMMKTRPKGYVGGGSMTVWNSEIISIGDSFSINQDSFISKYIIASNRFIWMSSIYINKGTKKNFLDTMASIQEVVPEEEWPLLVLSGDWNIDISALESESESDKTMKQKMKRALAVKEICRQMNLNILCPGATRKESSINFIIYGSEIKIENVISSTMSDVSDHCKWTFDIEIACPKAKNSIRIPNRKLADSFTVNSLLKAREASDFLKNIENRLRSVDMNLTKELKRKPFRKELLQRLMSTIETDEDFRSIINDYWSGKALENEMHRFSDKSRDAFDFLRRVFKYHEYNRRDGSIINKVVESNGTVIVEKEEVDKKVVEALKSIQLKMDQPYYDVHEPFPRLEEPSEEETEDLFNQLSVNKAISFDGVTDIIFGRNWREEACRKLKNLWTVMAERGSKIHQIHFDQRLLPLNKVHPQVPKPQECRPIVISSPLVKLLEVRIKRRLEKYVVEKLVCSQVGFVPGSSITVNQTRLLERVRLRTAHEDSSLRKHVFGLFIDFSNAYNTVLHHKLFEKLEKALSKEEIQLVKALYSRNRIRLGNQCFTPNVGVAQGSVISPSLFNVYCEDLYIDIMDRAVVLGRCFRVR